MARRTMFILGFLAFAITIFGGLVSQNSFEFTLSRALWAMMIFALLGMVIGWVAQRVILEYRTQQYERIYSLEADRIDSSEKPEKISSTPAAT